MTIRTARLFAVAALALPLMLAASGAGAQSPFSVNLTPPIDSVGQEAAKNDPAAVSALLAAGHDPNEEDNHSETGLIIAAKNDNMLIARILIKADAHTDVADRLGNTPLHYAAERNFADMTQLLLAAGAAVDPQNHDGMTPLMLAASGGHFVIVEALLAKGASVTKTDYTGRNALDWARDNNRTAVMQLLQRAEARR